MSGGITYDGGQNYAPSSRRTDGHSFDPAQSSGYDFRVDGFPSHIDDRL